MSATSIAREFSPEILTKTAAAMPSLIALVMEVQRDGFQNFTLNMPGGWQVVAAPSVAAELARWRALLAHPCAWQRVDDPQRCNHSRTVCLERLQEAIRAVGGGK